MSSEAISCNQTLLQVNNLTIQIARQNRRIPAIQNLSFSIHRNETLALVGESGSGKTLTALALLGLLPKNVHQIDGRIEFANKPVIENSGFSFSHLRGKKITMIFQEAQAALNPVFRVGVQITDVIKTHRKLSSGQAKTSTLGLLQSVGFSEPDFIYRKYPHELSGGMAQRTLIAMALSCDPELILADEPTTALDATTQIQILQLIKKLQKERGFALLLISHDIHLVESFADSILVLKAGQFIESGTAKQLLRFPRHEYTKALLSATYKLSLHSKVS